ncbi:VOC family protein [Actibacterium lipolyticum]|uniref:27 kDa antigen Cfp30B n=1 Tax=Actibacterium lipolyticum TaxID=1524263 RepID=A0A238KP87_9RHOB|nr:VOC family protein [Actibacterium lipolyticum]SMX44643.1 27 kDa antigen Cfp30B [Actibacterium lipolyticum]
MSDNHGKVWWTELMTRDVPAALEYYKTTCGWTISEQPMGKMTYYIAMQDGKPTAGLMDIGATDMPPETQSYWLSYFAVDDVDAAVAQTEKIGGRVHQAPFDIPGTGRIAIVYDPAGAMVGLMTPEPMD